MSIRPPAHILIVVFGFLHTELYEVFTMMGGMTGVVGSIALNTFLTYISSD